MAPQAPPSTEADLENAIQPFIEHHYQPYFKNHGDASDSRFRAHPTDYPVVELEYPNSDSVERFIILAPKDKEEYNPITDLVETLYTIVECYMTPEQQALLGPIPAGTLFDSDLDDAQLPLGFHSTTQPNLLFAVQWAIHRRDGPAFLKAFEDINAVLKSLKYANRDTLETTGPNALMTTVKNWTWTGIPHRVVIHIMEETYLRIVGPHVQEVTRCIPFSSEVYGELLPSLVYEIVQRTKLNANSLFIDLGSGVGNVVVQASLQTGCTSFGIELNKTRARIATRLADHFGSRCGMWGIKCGRIELEQGDMLTSPRVGELVSLADVVLVDNKLFDGNLQAQLRQMFLDLKEGAFIVCLVSFTSHRSTQRHVDELAAMLHTTEYHYHSESVSWSNNCGQYYLHRVDRKQHGDPLCRS